VRESIAFLIHTPLVYDHYRNIISKLKVPYVLVTNTGETIDGCPSITFDDARKEKFMMSVSVHYISGNSMKSTKVRNLVSGKLEKFNIKILSRSTRQKYLPLQIADFNVRLSYGLHLSSWDLGKWNNLYNLFLCHGPIDGKAFRDRFEKTVIEVGYPRYSNARSISLTEIKEELNLGNSVKPIIVWLPTYGDMNSLDTFPELVNQFQKYGHLIIRPHPLSWRLDASKKENYLKKFPNTIFDFKEDRDMTPLYMLADYVVADYGGPVMSAVYLERPIILINNPTSDRHENVENSVALEIRKYLPSFGVKEILNGEIKFANLVKEITDTKVREMKLRYFGEISLRNDKSDERASDALEWAFNKLKIESNRFSRNFQFGENNA
jgi:hypothetical protein